MATEFNDAIAQCVSLPCIGFAHGANGAPAGRQSGVAPVLDQYTTLDVIVRSESVA